MSNLTVKSASIFPADLNPGITIEDQIKNKENLNLAISIAESLSANNGLITTLNNVINEFTYTVGIFNKVLETYLINMSSTSSIISFDNTSVTPHYNKRSLLGYPKTLPFRQYIKVLTYTGQKSWIGPYGSMYYELKNSYFNYRHPSELVNISFTRFINNQTELGAVTKARILELLEDETEDADYLLYSSHIDYLRDFGLFTPVLILDYLEDFFREAFFILDNDIEDSEYVSNVIQTAIISGVAEDTLVDLSYRFVHQDLSPIELEVLNSVIERLKTINIEEIKNERVFNLLDKAIRKVGLDKPNDYFTKWSYTILEKLAEPGGFNYVLLHFSTLLLNRAYCLTHSNYTNYSDFPMDLDSFDEEGLLLISRVARLLYYSGTLLKKSNLLNLNVYGNNLCNLLKIVDSPSLIKRVLA